MKEIAAVQVVRALGGGWEGFWQEHHAANIVSALLSKVEVRATSCACPRVREFRPIVA